MTSSSSARRSTPARTRAAAQREGLHSRIRRADRQAAVDLSHDPTARRIRQRHLAEGLLRRIHRQHRRLGADSADEELGLAYLPIELPTHDYLRRLTSRATTFQREHRRGGPARPGCANGTTSWCITASGTWTFRAPPILADITVNGRTVKALAQPTKQAFLYVLNRETGEPIWPIEERPVPKGDTPGEWYSPTQPFPTKPPAYDGQGLRSTT